MSDSRCPKCDNDVQGADLRQGVCPFCGFLDNSPYPEKIESPAKKSKKAEAVAIEEEAPVEEPK